MPIISSSAVICLIACHGVLPADHFATYAEALTKQGYNVQIYATGPSLKKFQDRGVTVNFPFSLDDLKPEQEDELAAKIAKECSAASLVLTDLGHPFDIKIQKALVAREIPNYTYYDNPENFVPGGYSTTAAKVIEVAKGVFFANETLANAKIYGELGKEIHFNDKTRFGIGYYPVVQAEKIAVRRKAEYETMRSEFLKTKGIEDSGQKILVYFGGNNDEYFSKAFPAFLSILAQASQYNDLSNTVILLQQHPGAKPKNLDGNQLASWLEQCSNNANIPKMIVSDTSSDNAQIIADAAFYYQTSMGPQFILAGIPCIQIGHETYEDVLIRNGLAPSVTNAVDFAKIINSLNVESEKPPKDLVLKGLGIREDWANILDNSIKMAMAIQDK